MAKFMVTRAASKKAIPANFTELPAPSPADFGLPTDDDGARDDPLLGANNGATSYEHDFGHTPRGVDPHRDRSTEPSPKAR